MKCIYIILALSLIACSDSNKVKSVADNDEKSSPSSDNIVDSSDTEKLQNEEASAQIDDVISMQDNITKDSTFARITLQTLFPNIWEAMEGNLGYLEHFEINEMLAYENGITALIVNYRTMLDLTSYYHLYVVNQNSLIDDRQLGKHTMYDTEFFGFKYEIINSQKFVIKNYKHTPNIQTSDIIDMGDISTDSTITVIEIANNGVIKANS